MKMYVALPKRRRLGDGDDPFALTEMGPGPTLPGSFNPDLTNFDLAWNWVKGGFNIGTPCSTFDIACANRQAMIKQGQAQVLDVCAAAKANYGADSAVAKAACDTATYQASQIPFDVDAILKSIKPVGPVSIPWWVWALGAGLGVLILVKR